MPDYVTAAIVAGSGIAAQIIARLRFVVRPNEQGRCECISGCTDHRIGLTLYKLDQIVNGELQLLIDGLTADYQARLLAEQEVA